LIFDFYLLLDGEIRKGDLRESRKWT